MCIATFPTLNHPKFSPSCDASEFVNQSNLQKHTEINRIDTVPKYNFVVQHNYHDHANEKIDHLANNRPCRGGVATPFPLKLHEMLHRVEEDGHADIVSWQPHGRCFVIHKPKQFNYILPKYFKLSKITSFQRQLNLYGFSRLTSGRDKGGYYHELFLRGKQFLASKIQRIKVKGTGVRARSNPQAEPDLWKMDWVGCDIPLQCASSEKTLNVNPQPSLEGKPKNEALVCSFEGKQFYSLGQRINGVDSNLSNEEIENILSDLDFGDVFEDVNSEVASDADLADLLDRVIA